MLFLLSPAKALDYDSPVGAAPSTIPIFAKQSSELINILKNKSPEEISKLMGLSDALVNLNIHRYNSWRPTFNTDNSRQAVLAFNGDVYEGLDSRSLKTVDLVWAQSHLIILSGLYGVLRPLDLMRPYRLEMGTALSQAKGKNLYEFWGHQITDYLNEQMVGDLDPTIVNLASQEYFKSVHKKVLRAKVVECVFEDYKSGKYKIISFFAKRARGLMARYAIMQRVKNIEKLKEFNVEGYSFVGDLSTAERFVFRRKIAP